MLDGVAHFVRGDRDGRYRTAVMVSRKQPHHALFGIVMIAPVRRLHRYVLEPEAIQEMAREFAAATWQVGPILPMTVDRQADQRLRQHRYDEEGENRSYSKHGCPPSASDVTKRRMTVS